MTPITVGLFALLGSVVCSIFLFIIFAFVFGLKSASETAAVFWLSQVATLASLPTRIVSRFIWHEVDTPYISVSYQYNRELRLYRFAVESGVRGDIPAFQRPVQRLLEFTNIKTPDNMIGRVPFDQDIPFYTWEILCSPGEYIRRKYESRYKYQANPWPILRVVTNTRLLYYYNSAVR